MIKDLGPIFDPENKSRKHLVEFALRNYIEAINVYVVDDFCCWFPGAQPMKRQGEAWKLIIPLHEGEYQYAYVVDGYEWLVDQDNPEKSMNIHNMKCSLFKVGEKLLSVPCAKGDGKIELNGLYHDQTSRYLDINGNYAHFKFRTKKNDVTRVALVLMDKNNSEKEVVMEKSWEDKYFDYYEGSIPVKSYPLKYFFRVNDGDTTAYFSTSGASYNKDAMVDFSLNEAIPKIFQVSEWAKGAVFYQIFPDRFYNGDKNNDPPKLANWGERPTRHNFFGGDLQGIIEKLDYLASLGVNAIYLTPIFRSKSNHKYDTYEYFQVDPHFGDDDKLKTLVKEAHKRGIKLILDAVFHHTSDQFYAFKDLLKKKKKSKYVNWYFVRKFPLMKNSLIELILMLPLPAKFKFRLRFRFPPFYETFASVPYMPKLNLLNPETAEYFMMVAEYWVRETNIDGWRFDVAFGIPYEFWKELRARLKRLKPDVYLLGEFGNGNPDPSAWVGAETFDAVMNYPLRSIILDFVVFQKIGVEEFHQRLMELMGKLPKKTSHVMYNLLGSHDTSRLLTICEGDVKKAKLAIFLQMTLPGAPAIYYGDEVGLQGENDPDCRRTMPWNTEKWNMEILNHYKQLMKIRKNYPALNMGDLKIVTKDERKSVYAFKRVYKKDFAIVYINNGVKDAVVSIKSSEPLLEALSGKFQEPKKGSVTLTLPSKEGRILREEKNKC